MKKIVATKKSPAAVGAYNQGIICNGMLYISGQIPLVPETGEMVEGDIQVKTTRVMENLRGILEEAGCDFSSVVKTTIFVADINNFVAVNDIYKTYFGEDAPARSCVEVSNLPKGAEVEMDLIAYIK